MRARPSFFNLSGFLLIGLCFSITGCGVKGDPVPPDRPAELGRGRPTYRRATEKLKVVPVDSQQDKDKATREGEE